MKKVCHISTVHKRYDARVFEKECTTLARNGYDVYYVVNDDLCDEIKNNVKITSTDYVPKGRIQRMLFSTKKVYKKAYDVDADIYHIHDPELLPIGLKLFRHGKKVIFDSHEVYEMQIREKEYIPKLIRNLVASLYKNYETYVCKKINAVVVPSYTDGKNVFENRAKKIALVNNVPPLESNFDDSVLKKKNNIVCYTGALTYDRGILQLIRACYKADTKLILAGNISESFMKDMTSLPEYSIVDYKGLLPWKELINIYNESSIGACTLLNIGQYNKGDNLATKVYEYMANGIPVILSDSKYVRTILKEYKFGIPVNPDDIDEISIAILKLNEDKELARFMGNEGKRAFKEKFNWSIEEKNLLELYKNL